MIFVPFTLLLAGGAWGGSPVTPPSRWPCWWRSAGGRCCWSAPIAIVSVVAHGDGSGERAWWSRAERRLERPGVRYRGDRPACGHHGRPQRHPRLTTSPCSSRSGSSTGRAGCCSRRIGNGGVRRRVRPPRACIPGRTGSGPARPMQIGIGGACAGTWGGARCTPHPTWSAA